MNRKRVIHRIAPLVLAVFAAALLLGCGGGYRSIVVSSVAGGVLVEREGQADAISAYDGMKLQDKDVVTVPDSGGAVLKLDDDKYVYLEPGAKVRIGAAGGPGGTKTDFELLAGAMSAVIQKKLAGNESFSVTVENVSMVVRGTIFRVAIGENETGNPTVTVQTVEGQVGVDTGAGGEDPLGANRQDVILLTDTGGTLVSADTPIDYTELPPETLQWLRDALEDKLNAATDPDEIETLEDILAVLGGAAAEAEATPTPTPAATPTPTPTPTQTPVPTPTAEPLYTLTVRQPSHGSVQAAGGSYPAGAKISVRAVPDDGYRFAGWSVSGASSSGLGSGASGTFTMPSSNVTISAKFSQIQVRYTLSIAQPAEGGTVGGAAGQYAPGSQVTLTATPAAGYALAGWLVNGSVSASLGTGTSISYTMPGGDVTISAVFTRTHALTIDPQMENGTINGAGQYAAGATIPLTATASDGYMLTEWRVDGVASSALGTAASVSYTMPDSDVMIGANFELAYLLTIVQPQGGTIQGTGGLYPVYTEIDLTAVPDSEEYKFEGWTLGGSVIQEWSMYYPVFPYVVQPTDATISAVFTQILYDAFCDSQTQGGTIEFIEGKYAKGANIPITVTPDQGMELKYLIVGNDQYFSYAGAASIDFTMPGKDVTISAFFGTL